MRDFLAAILSIISVVLLFVKMPYLLVRPMVMAFVAFMLISLSWVIAGVLAWLINVAFKILLVVVIIAVIVFIIIKIIDENK